MNYILTLVIYLYIFLSSVSVRRSFFFKYRQNHSHFLKILKQILVFSVRFFSFFNMVLNIRFKKCHLSLYWSSSFLSKNRHTISRRTSIYKLLKFSSLLAHTHTHTHTHIYIYIIIIMSRYQHRYPWPSLTTSPYRPLLPAQSCCMYVRACRPAFACPCEGVHRSTSLMSSSLLLQQYTECLVRLILIYFMMGGRWPYSCCFVGCCLQD